MVYAYDNWVQLPTKDIYDTQMMAMAINAAKDMYNEGQQQMKDFQTEYGNFITPILADQEWYNNNVIGKVRNTINALYAAGIDPSRSAEGRAAISQLINSIDVGSVNKLRSSAENAKEYLKERAKLELQGLYNPIIEKYAGEGLDTFDTLRGGKIWDRMSPVPYQNMADFSKAYFDNISPLQRSATKNGVTYTISEVTEPMLQDIADRHFNDLVQTPQGQLMYKYYKDVYGSDEAARAAFNNAVVSGNLDRRKYADDYNEQYINDQKLKQGWAKINQDAAQFNWQKFTDAIQLGLDPYTGLPSGPSTDLSYTTQMETNSIAEYNKKAGVNSPSDYARTTYDIAQYWKNVADKQSDKDKKDHATKLYNLWQNINKAGLEGAEKYGTLVKDKDTGELVPSKMYTRGIGYAYGAPATGKTSVDKAREQADIYYNNYLVKAGGTEYDKTSADLLAGGTGEKKSFPGGAATNKYRTVSLDDKDIYFTPIRRMQVSGYDTRYAKLLNAFNDWLHGSARLGYMVNDNTSTASLPTSNGGRTREISGYARVKSDDIYNGFIVPYMREHNMTNSSENVQWIMDRLGLSYFKMQGREPLKGKNVWKDAEVAEIPITRVRINSNSLVDAAQNTHHDENVGGKAQAEKKLISRQKESLNKR